MNRPRVLFISPDAVGERMAGLGIRYAELGRVLAGHANVTVATGDGAGDGLPGLRVVAYAPHAPAALRPEIEAADAIVAPPQWPTITRWMRGSTARLIFDLYDPETFETLELFAGRRARRLFVALTLDRLHDALRTGHHFMCASETQRDLWLGALLAQRAIDPAHYDADPTLRSVLDLVPFGLPAEPPRPRAGTGPRGRLVDANAELVLWNGGIWRWLDADTAIRAVAQLAASRPRLQLVFMGVSEHPAARVATARARAVAAELGLIGDRVIFEAGWVPYAERSAWLTEADCAVSAQHEHLETRFAFRTRILDCVWAGLPVVCTAGDALAEQVAREGLGAVANPGDADALARALAAVLDRGRAGYAGPLARAAAGFTWPAAAAPLVRWVTTDGDVPQPLRPSGPSLAARARSAAYEAGGRRVLGLR